MIGVVYDDREIQFVFVGPLNYFLRFGRKIKAAVPRSIFLQLPMCINVICTMIMRYFDRMDLTCHPEPRRRAYLLSGRTAIEEKHGDDRSNKMRTFHISAPFSFLSQTSVA